MRFEIKRMETEEEIRGKAFVHWKSWHEAYPGLVDRDFLDSMTREKCEETAFRRREGLLVAKDGDRVAGFVGYGGRGEEDPDTGEIFALYVLAEYWGRGPARLLMEAALHGLRRYPRVCVRVLKENRRAIRFYEKYGFVRDGKEEYLPALGAAEIRMIRKIGD